MNLLDSVIIVSTLLGLAAYFYNELIKKKSGIHFGDVILSVFGIWGAMQIFWTGLAIILFIYGFEFLISNLLELSQYLGIMSLVLVIGGVYLFAKIMGADISEYFRKRGKK